ncbi:MAG: hypothetical protein JWR68_3194 [Polaromonas sp.]|nr:hypothetical protein [Polaromonas sp.]
MRTALITLVTLSASIASASALVLPAPSSHSMVEKAASVKLAPRAELVKTSAGPSHASGHSSSLTQANEEPPRDAETDSPAPGTLLITLALIVAIGVHRFKAGRS